MKTKSIIGFLLLSLVFGASFTSCEDMLSSDSDRHSYESAKDTLYNYWGILKTLQNVAERQVLLGELRGDMVMAEHVSDSLSAIAEFDNPQDGDCRYLAVRDYYAIINNCNAYLAACDTMRPIYGSTSSTTNKYMIREYAQVEAIRAWTYLQLVQLYGEVPFYLEPLTNSDAVDAFMASPVKANRYNLYEHLAARLLNVANVDYPEYGMYDGMVGSFFCFFPVRLVLGDIFLVGDRYAEAAQQYHAYMRDNKYTKAYLPQNVYASSHLSFDNSTVNYTSSYDAMFSLSDQERPNSDTEVITVIPSTTNKLWGHVLRGINEAFGYTSKVSVSGSGSSTSSSARVTLTPEHDKRQFVASKAFDRLCADYPTLRVNIKASSDNSTVYEFMTYHEGADTVVNGQHVWTDNDIYKQNGENQIYRFIQKQNPDRSFQTGYPIIYRKSLVWLRYAEALNRAGFPEYAYSVLHDGLTTEFAPQETSSDASFEIYAPWVTYTDTLAKNDDPRCWRQDPPIGVLLPYQCDTTLAEKILGKDGKLHYHFEDCRLDTAYYAFNTRDLGFSIADIESLPEIYRSYYACDTTKIVMSRQANESVNKARPFRANTHISAYEFNQAQNTTYLDFSSPNFKNVSSRMMGVMSRGNGRVELATDPDTLCYGFEVAMKRKWKEKGWGNFRVVDKYVTPGLWQQYQDRLVEAVEEMILDQMGLETCFEGHRFNDLMRIAFHRNDASFLADKVSKRRDTANPDMNLRSKLLDKNNWFFKLPNK